MEKTQTRLNKYLSEVGFCSRREADKLIDEGRVTVNGVIPEMGTKVSEDDEICVNGQLIVNKQEKNIYLAFYKPVGIECTTNTTVRDNIVDYINYPTRIFPIGRLDKDSEGLILMTNDGDIVNKILRQKNNHEKEYIVTVNKPLTDRFIQRMGAGVPILDTVTKKCRVEAISKTVFRIFLTQGLNRQIRRMCEYFDYDVVALKRIRIINISLDVSVGTYRNLKQEELDELNRLIEPSVMTEEASLNRNEESQQSIRRRMTTGKDSGRRDSNGKYSNRRDANNSNDRRPKRNFDREKNDSTNKPKEVKNERLRNRRREN
ncbi:23S rRNA pseudouridine(2604) synthase RluF [Myroides sp. M-43]|uniref:23S rRNA pseudouridine(2604) synthase RluF n=1 Tax=Myroides oncorhynchi TaxID=2893756 RepID=UPI001E5A1110|nr:23S rRNA pseudouridine(2604) synthase RluF [Myroides oncorhynchi]MCC9043097.1 23S rRNA pseudouridine(2604) synthase RluF [Myroides oncorhynchi]